MRWIRHLRERRQDRPRIIATVTIDERTFRVTEQVQFPGQLVAWVYPHPRRRMHRPGSGAAYESSTHVRFKVLDVGGRRRGLVTNIGVDPSEQRQGWATAMVRVLLHLYPDCVWTVESPNEQSGQLFLHLAERHPGTIVGPDLVDEYPVDDRRRYRTPEQW